MSLAILLVNNKLATTIDVGELLVILIAMRMLQCNVGRITG